MSENKCQSLENSVPLSTAKFPSNQLPKHFESYRDDLHREMAMHWPYRPNSSPSSRMRETVSKSATHAQIGSNKKSVISMEEQNALHQASSQLRSNPATPATASNTHGKTSDVRYTLIPTDSEISLEGRQQRIEWNLKAQEGILTYPLPDGLPDGQLLHNKLQKLMKTDTIYLNDRRFWTTLEYQFKHERKENLFENMKRLRQKQQQYEEELLSKGSIPFTTEEAIRRRAEEQQRSKLIIDPNTTSNVNPKNCLIDSTVKKTFDSSQSKTNADGLDAFETDNVHPNFHHLLSEYQFQTKSGREIQEKSEKDLVHTQTKIKTIFPKFNQRDQIRQELEAVKTSEGLYAYSNRLMKRMLK